MAISNIILFCKRIKKMKKIFSKIDKLFLSLLILSTFIISACDACDPVQSMHIEQTNRHRDNDEALNKPCEEITNLDNCLQPRCMEYAKACYDKDKAKKLENTEIQRIKSLSGLNGLIELEVLKDEGYKPSNSVISAINDAKQKLYKSLSQNKDFNIEYEKALIADHRIKKEKKDQAKIRIAAMEKKAQERKEQEKRQQERLEELNRQQAERKQREEAREKEREERVAQDDIEINKNHGIPKAVLGLSLEEILANDENLDTAKKKLSEFLNDSNYKRVYSDLSGNILKEAAEKLSSLTSDAQKNNRMTQWLKHVFDNTYPENLGIVDAKEILKNMNKEQRENFYSYLGKVNLDEETQRLNDHQIKTDKFSILSDELDRQLNGVYAPEVIEELAVTQLPALEQLTLKRNYTGYIVHKLIEKLKQDNIKQEDREKIKKALQLIYASDVKDLSGYSDDNKFISNLATNLTNDNDKEFLLKLQSEKVARLFPKTN